MRTVMDYLIDETLVPENDEEVVPAPAAEKPKGELTRRMASWSMTALWLITAVVGLLTVVSRHGF